MMEEVVPSERQRVNGWRLDTLISSGYDVEIAERVAASDVDLHRAVELIVELIAAAGCSPALAADILL